METSKRLLLVVGSARGIKDGSNRVVVLLAAALLCWLAPSRIAQAYDPYSGPDSEIPSLRLSAGLLSAAETQGPISVSISSLNAQSFPFVFLDIDATDDTGTCPLLSAGNFTVYEDNVLQTNYFAVTPPNENQGVRLVDVVFIMDNSGSMGADQVAVRNNVYGFVDKLGQAGINYAFGLTRFGQSASSGAPIIENNGNLTSDAAYFKDTLWARNTVDGGLEPGYWAIVESAGKFHYRPGSRRVFIIITDESPNQGGASIDQAAAALQSGDVTLFAVTETVLFSSFQALVADPTQQILGLTTSFDQIFAAVSDLLANTYRVTYKAQNENIDGLERSVEVHVMCGANGASDTTTYTPGSEPTITRTRDTVALSEVTQPAQTALTIAVQVTDRAEPLVQTGGVRLYYRPTSTDANAPYKIVTMGRIAQDTYSADIVAGEVSEPGIDYYLSATDGVSTSTDPRGEASARPYTIAVFPNDPPVLLHTAVTEAQVNKPILMCARAYDTTQRLAGVSLHYRKKGELIYQMMPMVGATAGACVTAGTSNAYEGTISQEQVTLNGVEYFIDAVDNYTTRTTSGSAGQPHFIAVATEPTVPVLAVTPTTGLEFGSVVLGQCSLSQHFTVRNTGGQLLDFTCTVQPPFYLVTSPCVYNDIASGQSADVALYFNPSSAATVIGTMTFRSNGGDASRTLTGTGTPAPHPVIEVVPTSLSFDPQPVGTASAFKSVTVRNAGTSALILGALAVNGTNLTDYHLQGDACSGTSLSAGISCTFGVTFSPTTAGTRSASVTIPNNDSSHPMVAVSLTGTAKDADLHRSLYGIPSEFVFDTNMDNTVSVADVRYLQIVLNKDSDTRVNDKDKQLGSPGFENRVFGALTTAAVARFQDKYHDAIMPGSPRCADLEQSRWVEYGCGRVGPNTRAKLNALINGLRAAEDWGLAVQGRKSSIRRAVEGNRPAIVPDIEEGLILGAIINEIGGVSYNNEWVRAVLSETTGLLNEGDYGRGIMQLSSKDFVSTLNKDGEDCKNVINSNYQCSRYYSNTEAGIARNLSDGLGALASKYSASNCEVVTQQCQNKGEGVAFSETAGKVVLSGACGKPVYDKWGRLVRNATVAQISTTVTSGVRVDMACSPIFRAIDALWRYNGRTMQTAGTGLGYVAHVSANIKEGRVADEFGYVLPDKELWLARLEAVTSNYAVVFRIKSPARIYAMDEQGRVAGVYQGAVREEIPFARYDEAEEYVEIPLATGEYRYVVEGFEEGRYGLEILRAREDERVVVQLSGVPIKAGEIYRLSVDWDRVASGEKGVGVERDRYGDGSVIDVFAVGANVEDRRAPETDEAIAGNGGRNGWFQSDVTVRLSADDGDGVGVEATRYSVDGALWEAYEGSKGIAIGGEGVHTLRFYSVDYFGNQEEVETVTIRIDKTAPEASITVDPSTRDLKVVGIDGESEVVITADARGNVTLTDEAGHTTKLFFQRTYSGKLLTFARLTRIEYDNTAVTGLSNSTFVYIWKPGTSPPQLQSQTIVVNGRFTIEAVFYPRTNTTTVIVTMRGASPQKMTFAGQKIVKVTTRKGVLDYDL